MRKLIVALILYKDGKVLVEERKKIKGLDPGKIVFPGGHVMQDESLEEALKREAKEELGVEIIEAFLVYQLDVNNESEDQHIYWFGCESFSGDIVPTEANQVFWVDPNDTSKFSYQDSIDALQAYLEVSGKRKS